MDAAGNVSSRTCDSIGHGESWENGLGNWYATNGIWQVGTPTAGPESCFSGNQCAGTILDGNYPVYTDSILVSAATALPTVTGLEEIHLRFRHWFSYSSNDSGQVLISVWNAGSATWGAWVSDGTYVVNTSSWTLKDVDLTAYAGERIRFGFSHVAAPSGESTGWYIDDIEIVKF